MRSALSDFVFGSMTQPDIAHFNPIKGIMHGGFYIYINLEILPCRRLCIITISYHYNDVPFLETSFHI